MLVIFIIKYQLITNILMNHLQEHTLRVIPWEMPLGSMSCYQSALAKIEPERTLYLAIHQRIYADVFEEEM